MITPSFNLTATERVLPKLALDFTTASLDSRITFTRTTDATHPATYVNSSGYITASTNNQPRFDYDPVTLACKGLLIEESRSNLLTYSGTLNNAAWSVLQATIGASGVTSPSGTTDAYTLTGTGGTAYLYRTTAYATSAIPYTISIFAKAGTNTSLTLYFVTSGNSNGGSCSFNLSTGVAGTPTNYGSVSGTVASIVNFGNGWYRCSITLTPTASNYFVQVSHVGTNTTYLYGFQVEQGAFATSYIPTTTAALTRNADVATMTGTNFSDWFNASEGTFEAYGTTAPGISGTQYILSATDGTTSNMILMYRQLSGYMGTGVYTAGVVQHDSNTGVLQASSSNVNGALSVKAGGAYRAFNAANNTAIGLTTMPSVNQFQIGNRTDLARAWNGTIARIDYYPQKLTNNEVIAISK